MTTKVLEWEDLVDKSSWGEGVWQDEPDKILWVDPKTDYLCMVVRGSSRMGHLCGYVGVPEDHPDHGKHYDKVDVNVHGGLTFAGDGVGHPLFEDRFASRDDDNVWWLGFDCAHCFDYKPGFPIELRNMMRGEEYRDLEYTKEEVTGLAGQLFRLAITE